MTEHEWLTCQHSPNMRNFLYFSHEELLRKVEKWLPERIGYVVPVGDREWKPPADARRCDIIREVVGNPFNPIRRMDVEKRWDLGDNPPDTAKVVNTGWLNDTVLSVAQAIVERGCYEEMPMLADALEEAGCDNEEILQHCRQMERCQECEGKGGENYPADENQSDWFDDDMPQEYQWYDCDKCNGDCWIPKPVPCLPGCWVLRLILDSSEQ